MQHPRDRTEEFARLSQAIQDMDNLVARRDLTRMLKTAQQLEIELSKELVNCRRLGRLTNDYQRIEYRLDEQLRQTGKWLTMALLKF